MKKLFTTFVMGLVIASAMPASANDSVVIESKTVPAGATDVAINIRLTNDDTLFALTVPLEFREITPGSFITALSLEYAERLIGTMDDYRFANQYAAKDGSCVGGHTAYGIPTYRGADSSFPVTASPWGALYSTFRRTPNAPLAPGADSVGSLIARVSVSGVAGSFEIDTVCIQPVHALTYVVPNPDGLSLGVHPSFTKGVITISSCNCSFHGDLDGDTQITALDLGLLIDYLFASGPAPPTDPGCPHNDRGDVNCDGFDEALDMAYLIDHLFASGPPPCDPCACDPYPPSCP